MNLNVVKLGIYVGSFYCWVSDWYIVERFYMDFGVYVVKLESRLERVCLSIGVYKLERVCFCF